MFFNKSGAYVSLGGVYEAKYKSAVIKKIVATVFRASDNAQLYLEWSTFPSPVCKRVSGGLETSFEAAHPIKVNTEQLEPVFVEFANGQLNMENKVNSIMEPVYSVANQILATPNIDITFADMQLRQTAYVQGARTALNDEFFWKPGDYSIVMVTKYNSTSQMSHCFKFNLSESESQRLRYNIESILVEPIANYYGRNLTINSIQKRYIKK